MLVARCDGCAGRDVAVSRGPRSHRRARTCTVHRDRAVPRRDRSRGAYRFSGHSDPGTRRVGLLGFGVLACVCFLAATFLPLFLGARLSVDRPSTTARLTVTAPRPGEVFRGDPATIPVSLQLDGGQVVPATSLRLVPNEGHIHLSLDGSLIAMTGLVGDVSAAPGPHTLSAEFVAIDHGPFQPRVIATVTFTAVR